MAETSGLIRVFAGMNFDPLARHYRWMEAVLAGRKLQLCRTLFLDQLPRADDILLLGEGPGRFLVPCRRRFPDANITCVDSSPRMIAEARLALYRNGIDQRSTRFDEPEVDAAGEPELRARSIPEKIALRDPALVAAGITARKPLIMPPVSVLEVAAASLSAADSGFVFFRERFAGEIGLVLLAGAYLTVALGSWLRLSHREWLILPAGVLLGVAAKMPFHGLHHGSVRTRVVALVSLLVVWRMVAWVVAGLVGVG